MASGFDDIEHEIENVKSTVRKSFALLYASLKARELKTLRQLDAINKQSENDVEFRRNCLQNIHISYDNQSTLLDNINSYGVIDLERLNFDSNMFVVEDYVSPNDDHMYSYKCIEEESNRSEIEEAALKQITSANDCVCYVNIRPEDVPRTFRDRDIVPTQKSIPISSIETIENVVNVEDSDETQVDAKNESLDCEMKKIYPTDDWLNSIKNQTETEPTQVSDIMEHSTIVCS